MQFRYSVLRLLASHISLLCISDITFYFPIPIELCFFYFLQCNAGRKVYAQQHVFIFRSVRAKSVCSSTQKERARLVPQSSFPFIDACSMRIRGTVHCKKSMMIGILARASERATVFNRHQYTRGGTRM